MPSGWDHGKVIIALVERKEKISSLQNVDVWVQLYPQNTKSALIYTQSSPYIAGKGWEVAVNPDKESFNPSIIDINHSCLKQVGTTNSKGWNQYKVVDWDAFADMLGLKFGEDTEEDQIEEVKPVIQPESQPTPEPQKKSNKGLIIGLISIVIIAILVFILLGCNSEAKNENSDVSSENIEMIDASQKSENIAYSNIQDFWVEFQKAMQNKDIDRICQLTNFPYEIYIWDIDEGETTEYSDEKEFRESFKGFFNNDKLISEILKIDKSTLTDKSGISINDDGIVYEFYFKKINGKYLLIGDYAHN